jgi:hypothetical protein
VALGKLNGIVTKSRIQTIRSQATNLYIGRRFNAQTGTGESSRYVLLPPEMVIGSSMLYIYVKRVYIRKSMFYDTERKYSVENGIKGYEILQGFTA